MGAIGRVVQVGLSKGARFLGDTGVVVKIGGFVFSRLPRQELIKGLSSKFFNFVLPKNISIKATLVHSVTCLAAGVVFELIASGMRRALTTDKKRPDVYFTFAKIFGLEVVPGTLLDRMQISAKAAIDMPALAIDAVLYKNTAAEPA